MQSFRLKFAAFSNSLVSRIGENAPNFCVFKQKRVCVDRIQNSNGCWRLYFIFVNDHAIEKVFFFPRWDPAARLTPDEAIQHEWIQEGRQRHRGTSRLTSRQKAAADALNPTETIPKGPTTIPAEPGKGHAEASLTKRSARTRERLQPIGADASHTAHHDKKNNITKQAESGTETKGAGVPLTKKIASEVVKEKPGTASKANDIEGERTDETTVAEGGQFLPPIK